MEQKREIDGGSMETMVKETLGYIDSRYSSGLVNQTVKYKLMLTHAVDR